MPHSCEQAQKTLSFPILREQGGFVGVGLGQELAVVVAVGMEGLVAESRLDGLPVLDELAGPRTEVLLVETLPDVVDGLLRGVQHVGLVEAVVAQLVEHNLVGREISDAGLAAAQLVGSQQQCGFGELTAVEAILGIADGADGDDDVDIGTAATQDVDSLREETDALLNRQFLLLKEVLRPLLTVVYYLARGLQAVDVVGAQGEEGDAGRGLGAPDGVEHGGGVVHGAERVDHNGEMLLLETPADAVGKAGAHKEQFLERLDEERGLCDVYYCAEIHICKDSTFCAARQTFILFFLHAQIFFVSLQRVRHARTHGSTEKRHRG